MCSKSFEKVIQKNGLFSELWPELFTIYLSFSTVLVIVSVLSFFQVSPSLSYSAISFISLTSPLLSVSLQTFFLPCFPLPSSLPPPPSPLFSSYLSIFCKLAALVRHRVSLFGKETAWWRYALSPSPSLCICFFCPVSFYFSRSFSLLLPLYLPIYILISIVSQIHI